MNEKELMLGLDIGTTTISLTIAEKDTGRQTDAVTIDNGAAIPGGKCQDPEIIREKALKLVADACSSHPGIVSIGLTGQMHGIVFLDAEGSAVSPLYTWQDEHGNLPYDEKTTYCGEILRRTGKKVPSGYGLSSFFWCSCNGRIPESAVTFCTIMDYVGMKLTGTKKPLVHSTNAASFGLYDLEHHVFYEKEIALIGAAGYLPETTDEDRIQGTYAGIPVSVAIGDNQAAFFGAVDRPEITVSVNCGTGSQISAAVDSCLGQNAPEIRPYIDGKYLLNGSALCGGRAYAILERFFRLYADAAGLGGVEQYEVLNRIAAEGEDRALKVRTQFAGTREDPSVRGSITGIGEDNFTPQAMAAGFLHGMADELYEMYLSMGLSGRTELVASGNAIRKNPALQKIFSETFGMNLIVTEIKEEAAYGAAKFGAICR